MRDRPQTHRSHGRPVFRGSRKRIARIRWRGNSSPELWILLIFLVVLLVVVVPWMIKHSEEWLHHDAHGQHQPTP
jgi:hypothetical protein